MAIKRIKKEQIESGKKSLPKKLAFLSDAKIDYSVVAHNEASDEWSVELSLAAIRALARKASELKDIKSSYKDLARQAALVPELENDRVQLQTLREAVANADSVMRKAVRRINALEKLLGMEPGAKLPVAAPSAQTNDDAPPKAIKAIKAAKAAKPKAETEPVAN